MKKDPNLHRCNGLPDPGLPVHIFDRTFRVKGPMFREHWHEQLQFFLFTGGRALIRINGRKIEVRKGSVIVANANDIHSAENLAPVTSFTTVCMNFAFFAGPVADRCQSKFIAPVADNTIIFRNTVPEGGEVQKILSAVIREDTGKKPGYELAIKGLLLQLLAVMIRNHSTVRQSESALEERTKRLREFRDIARFIDTHSDEKLTLDDIAEHAGMSRFHFCRSFRKMTGFSPMEYLNRVRIDKAAALLRENKMDITDVALTAGFDDPAYFCRLFKKMNGTSPSGFRKKLVSGSKVIQDCEEIRRA
jgi:AraC-like DNA-binding protein